MKTNSEKLRALADWFDAYDLAKEGEIKSGEVQKDLRAMAHEFEQLNKPNIMQAEGSDVSEGAAVGQRSVDTNAVRWLYCKRDSLFKDSDCKKQCDECRSYQQARKSSGGHL